MTYGGGVGNCLTGARFTMTATVLRQDRGHNVPGEDYGQWVNSQDPLTKEIVRVWKPIVDDSGEPNIPEGEETYKVIPCLARGIVDGGIRVAGTTERFGENYDNVDFVKMWVPPNVILTKRDRITNITDATGRIRWRDEEYETRDNNVVIDISNAEEYNSTLKATVFNVNGVTPLFNAFNEISEQFILLEKAEVGGIE